MGWKKFLFGASVGALTSLLLQKQFSNEYISAEKALKQVKGAFKEKGKIEGSWIYTEVERYDHDGVNSDVYRGGISRQLEDELQHYDFIVNAKTGTLITVTESDL
jgi:predicted small secreted protein